MNWFLPNEKAGASGPVVTLEKSALKFLTGSNPIQSNIYCEQTTSWTFTSNIIQYLNNNNLGTHLLAIFGYFCNHIQSPA